jgi:hypothetical protein
METHITLTWVPGWRAYAVRQGRRLLGMVACRPPLPFRVPATFS